VAAALALRPAALACITRPALAGRRTDVGMAAMRPGVFGTGNGGSRRRASVRGSYDAGVRSWHGADADWPHVCGGSLTETRRNRRATHGIGAGCVRTLDGDHPDRGPYWGARAPPAVTGVRRFAHRTKGRATEKQRDAGMSLARSLGSRRSPMTAQIFARSQADSPRSELLAGGGRMVVRAIGTLASPHDAGQLELSQPDFRQAPLDLDVVTAGVPAGIHERQDRPLTRQGER